jgi:hypothetical protein
MNDATHDDMQDAAGGDAASAAAGRAGLLAQLRQLEDFAARTTSEGDTLPPQATEMIAHLREIVQALDGLTASLTEEPTRGGESAGRAADEGDHPPGGAA